MMDEYSNQEYKYPIYTGPHFMCSDCKTMFISEEFLEKHQKKCIHRKFHLILKIKLQLRRNKSTDGKAVKKRGTGTFTMIHPMRRDIRGDVEGGLQDKKSNMNSHSRSHLYKCSKCKEKFSQEEDLNVHMSTVHREDQSKQSHLCHICLQSFNHSIEFYEHKRIHTEMIEKEMIRISREKITLSPHHPIDISSSSDHSVKLEEQHSSELSNINLDKKSFSCTYCSMKFETKSDCTLHLYTHNKESMFTCETCYITFKLKKTFEKHLLAHKNKPHHSKQRAHLLAHKNKPYPSKQHAETFKPSKNLKYLKGNKKLPDKKLKSHTNKNGPYRCDKCLKDLSTRASLSRHLLLVHSGIKEFKCGHCGSLFGLRQHLKEHLRIHTQTKPYECSVCHKRFTQSSTLRQHEKTHQRIIKNGKK